MLPLRRSAQDSSRVGLCSTTPRRREAIRRHPSRTQQTIIRPPLTWSDAIEFDLIGTAGNVSILKGGSHAQLDLAVTEY
jgi:hypothetical protein